MTGGPGPTVDTGRTMDDMATPAVRMSLDSESQRQILYACLLRYAPETSPLRERALDRLVLGALLGSDPEHPSRMGRIQKNLMLGTRALTFRLDQIQQVLGRLIADGRVAEVEYGRRHAYHLTPRASEELRRAIDYSESLFERVLRDLLKDTEHHMPYELGAAVCRTFICECLARFGAHLARMVVGDLDPDEFARIADVGAALDAAADRHGLPREARESLSMRCSAFLKSRGPDAVTLKFYLTQGYYVAQLLELAENRFNPIAEEAFRGSVFYLDTNVLLLGLFPLEGRSEIFGEMIGVAKRLGIELRVTRATINEIRRVVADRVRALDQLLPCLPEEIIARTKDQMVEAFFEARRESPALRPEDFFEAAHRLSQIVLDRWGVVLVDKTEEEVLAGRDFPKESRLIQEEALALRKFEKPDHVLAHDLCHYALVQDDRQSGNTRTWFLTRDRTLWRAGMKLRQDGEQAFCFSLLGLLQSLSPFLTTANEERCLADVFSGLLTEQVLTGEQLFSVRELLLLSQMSQDVLCTPKEQLLPALDYVKTTILRGEPCRPEDAGRVALGLRTFLASSSDERRKELEDRYARLEQKVAQERQAAAIELRDAQGRGRGLEFKVEELGHKNEKLVEAISHLSDEILELQAERKRDRKRIRIVWAAGGAVAGSACWLSRSAIVQAIAARYGPGWTLAASGAIRLVGLVVFCLPAFILIRGLDWRDRVREASLALVLLVALGFSGLLGNLASLPSFAGFFALLAAILLAVLGRSVLSKGSGRSE